MDTPSIYVACLASYNNAILHGVWIDAMHGEDYIIDEIQKMLANSPIENAEEFALHDYEGFGKLRLDEYESISTIVQYASFIQQHGELGQALLGDHGLEEAERMLSDCYQGGYDSEVDFARQLLDDCYAQQLPDNLMHYFDYDAFARDLFMCDYYSVDVGQETHVFSSY